MTALLTRLGALDRKLVAAGWPALSAWWLATFVRFLTSNVRQLVVRAGRRGGKSSSLSRLAVVFALYAQHEIPPGDIGVIAFISTRRDEAAQRLRTIKAILDVLEVSYKPIEDGIELHHRPIAFKVFAANVAAVSGFTALLIICDEVSKWRDAETGANPATDVLAALRPTMATQKLARIILSSSPLGLTDAHAKAFEDADTAAQMTAYAPTWEANPTITKAETRVLEPDDCVWRREYLAEPQAGALGAFDSTAIDCAFALRVVPPSVQLGVPLIIIDASSGRSDSWTWCLARWLVPPSVQFRMKHRYVKGSANYGPARYVWEFAHDAAGKRVEIPAEEHFPPTVRIEWIKSVDGAFWKNTSANAIAQQIASDSVAANAERIVGDQREAFALSSLFASHGRAFTSIAWTNPQKSAAVETARRWMRDKQLWLPNDERLKRELLEFEEKITPSGAITFGARGNRHDDRVALLLTLAMAETSGLLPMSPMTRRVRRDLTNLPAA